MDPLRKAIVFLPQRRKGSTQGAQRAMTCSSNVSDSSFRYAPFGMTTIYVNEEAASEAAKPPLMP
ncbi:MAG: hypothetical protein FWG84_02255, partial [Bacteroidales bacterium]|nr:hypothetical protein [Bacteroidales bacterium]